MEMFLYRLQLEFTWPLPLGVGCGRGWAQMGSGPKNLARKVPKEETWHTQCKSGMPCSMLSMDLSAGSITRMDPPNKFAEKEEDEIFYTCENRRSSSDQVWLAIVWIETALSELVPFDLPSIICVLSTIWHLNSSWKKSWKKFYLKLACVGLRVYLKGEWATLLKVTEPPYL